MAVRRKRTTRPDSAAEDAVRVLERGHIYFAYRPRVEEEAAHGLEDVQRVYMILSPRGKGSYRLLVIGQKRLPAAAGPGDPKAWAFVEKVSSRAEEVEDELDPKTYRTATRGERHRPAARPAGEGVYAIARHRGHTHLAYVLELPAEPGEVQRTLHIDEEASYIVAVKNPRTPPAPGVGLDEARAQYPADLQKRFRRRRFIPVDPPAFLDHEGAEIVLVGAGADVARELGLPLSPQHESEATAAVFEDLGMEKSLHPVTPLLTGRWA
jgi:hypothetical protein